MCCLRALFSSTYRNAPLVPLNPFRAMLHLRAVLNPYFQLFSKISCGTTVHLYWRGVYPIL